MIAPFVPYKCTINQVILIVSKTEAGNRTDESFLQDGNIIPVNIHFFREVPEKPGYTSVFKPGYLCCCYDFLFFPWRSFEINIRPGFCKKNREVGFSIDGRRIDVLPDKL